MTNDQAPMTNAVQHSKSEILNPKSQIRNRHRSAVTLLEVLFAIMVASVGLLGAIAVFPVAMAQARKGRIADTTAAGAQAAVGKVNAELMRRPDRWLWWDYVNYNPPQTNFLPLSFSRASPGNFFFGRAFCIDPRFFEQNRLEDAATGNNTSAMWSNFPAVPQSQVVHSASLNGGRMMRLTLHNNNPAALTSAFPMSFVQADTVFRLEDELLYQRPDDNSLPAVQLFNQMQTASGNVASRRQEEGRLTWMATLVPKLDRLRGQIGEEYVLSIVVFYNRSPDMHVPVIGATTDVHPWTEWTARVLGPNTINGAGDYHASGIGGGEVTITTVPPNVNVYDDAPSTLLEPDQLNGITRGSWVLLGTQVMSNIGLPVQIYQWYRVSDTGEEAQQVTVNNTQRYQRDLTLVGPDWPTDVNGDGTNDECDVIIVPGVVHVYERTIKLDTGAVQ